MANENTNDEVRVTLSRRFKLGREEFIDLWMGESRAVEDRSKKARSLARRSIAKQINEDLEYIADYINEHQNKE